MVVSEVLFSCPPQQKKKNGREHIRGLCLECCAMRSIKTLALGKIYFVTIHAYRQPLNLDPFRPLPHFDNEVQIYPSSLR